MNIKTIGAAYAAKDFKSWSGLPGFRGLGRTEEGMIYARINDEEISVTANKNIVINILLSKGLKVTNQRLDQFYMGYSQFMANQVK